MAKKFNVKLTGPQLRYLEGHLDYEPLVGWDEGEGEMVDDILRALEQAEQRAANKIVKRTKVSGD